VYWHNKPSNKGKKRLVVTECEDEREKGSLYKYLATISRQENRSLVTREKHHTVFADQQTFLSEFQKELLAVFNNIRVNTSQLYVCREENAGIKSLSFFLTKWAVNFALCSIHFRPAFLMTHFNFLQLVTLTISNLQSTSDYSMKGNYNGMIKIQ